MVNVIECLGGIFGILPMYRPYIPEPMRHALYRALQQYVPRNNAYQTWKEDYRSKSHITKMPETTPIEFELWVEYTPRAKITALDFPYILIPCKEPATLLQSEDKWHWRPELHHLPEHEFKRRMRLCSRLLTAPHTKVFDGQISFPARTNQLSIEDIPTTFPDMALYQGILQLATYIGMPAHELENMIAWEPQPLSHEEKAALSDMVSLHANKEVARAYHEQNKSRIHKQYAAVFGKRYSENWYKADNVIERLMWQMGEMVFYVGMCLRNAPKLLAQAPVKVQSGRHEDTPKREKTLPEMITEMEQELNSLPNYTAYVKAGSWKGKMCPPLPADLLLGEPIVDVSSIARKSAINARILRKREEIEAEIRERQENWREEPSDEPTPPTSTGGSAPPALPSGRSRQPEEPPPTYIPEKTPGNSDVAQPTTDTDENVEAQSHQEGRIIDFTAYSLRKRREERRRQEKIQEKAPDGQTSKSRQPRPPDVPIPRYEPLDYSSGPVTLHDFTDHLAPIVRAASYRCELLDSENGDSLVVSSALALQDRLMGSRVLHRILKRNCSMPYAAVGLLAVMLGETGIAEQLIQALEKRNDDFSDYDAGKISVQLPDKSAAQRLLRKCEEKRNHAATLHIAAEMGDTATMKRLLEDLIQYGVGGLTKGHLAELTRSLMKAVPYHPELCKRMLKVFKHAREVADIFAKDIFSGKVDPAAPKELDYMKHEGKLAALLGEKNYAQSMFAYCLEDKAALEAGEIAALLGDIDTVEKILSKHRQETRSTLQLESKRVGSILSIVAKNHLQAAEKIWMLFEEKFLDDSDYLAREIIGNIVPSVALHRKEELS